MIAIKMLDDFALMVAEIEKLGSFESYKRYTQKHPQLFRSVFEVLYMTPIEALRPMIEQVDFDALLTIGMENRADGLEQKIMDMARDVAQWYCFEDDFELYLGMELGHIGGFVGEPMGNRPFMFIGLDMRHTEKHWRQLVAHEFNHMVRFWKLARGIKFSDVDFLDRTIAEGLGVCSGLIYTGDRFSLELFARHNALSDEQFQDLVANETAICADVRSHFGEPMSMVLNQSYFVGSHDVAHWQKAYYYGAKIINSLVESGYSLQKLTLMPAAEIVAKYGAL